MTDLLASQDEPHKCWASSTKINGHLAIKVSTMRINNQQKPLWNVLEKPSSNWIFQNAKTTKALFLSDKEMEE